MLVCVYVSISVCMQNPLKQERAFIIISSEKSNVFLYSLQPFVDADADANNAIKICKMVWQKLPSTYKIHNAI